MKGKFGLNTRGENCKEDARKSGKEDAEHTLIERRWFVLKMHV
jgi:hypothetical protein